MRRPSSRLKQVHDGEAGGEAVAEKRGRRGGGGLNQRSDRASAQLGSSVIRGSDRCFLDKIPHRSFGGTHRRPAVSMVRH